jgi:prepilin-type N-terminal cleavage/methylation domain-containing protein
MMQASTNSTRGFTLTETIVVVAIMGLMMSTIGSMLSYFYKSNGYALQQAQAVQSARKSIQTATADLREATYGADGAYPIAAVGTSTVTFYANSDGDAAVEKVRYYLSGTTLYRGVTQPTGNPQTYVGQTEAVSLVIPNVRNTNTTPIFTYYDSSGTVLSVTGITTSAIMSVGITVQTDVNPNRAPAIYTLTGESTLRNLRNPATE